MLNASLYASNRYDWATPDFLFRMLDVEFNFTLDACASDDNAKCERYFTKEDDGLQQEWSGNVWINPPYGREIYEWIKKSFESSQKNAICVCLVPVRSDTRWWHNYVMQSKEIRLLTKRLTFEGATNKAPFPAAIVVFDARSTSPLLTSLRI